MPVVHAKSCSVWFEKNPAMCSAPGSVANIISASTRASRDSRKYISSPTHIAKSCRQAKMIATRPTACTEQPSFIRNAASQ